MASTTTAPFGVNIHSHRESLSPSPPGEEVRSRRRVKAEERTDRKKRWTTKVKTGCATCRARRIKCDEGKPVCRRCVFSKRQCGGYMDQPPPQYVSNSCCSSPSSTGSDLVAQPGNGMSAIYQVASSFEQQMFHRFRTETVLQVGCVFDMQFWLMDVPQAAQAHRPLWHASVALAALSGSRTNPADSMYLFADAAMDGLTSFVMQHYHAAIRELIPLSNPSGDAPSFENQQVLLMTNVLLLGLASMQGNQRDAAMFSRHSLTLFNDWRFWQRQDNWKTSSQGAMLSVAPLTALMYRLQSQEIADRLQRPDWLVTDFGQYTKLPSATPFASMTEAYRELQPILAGLNLVVKERLLRPHTDFKLPTPEHCLAFRYAFTAWKAKYDHFCDTTQSPETANRLEAMILDLFKATVENSLLPSNDYSVLIPMHHHMVDTAESILLALSTTDMFNASMSDGILGSSPEASSPSSIAESASILTPGSPPLLSGPRLGKPLPYSFGPVVLEPLFMVAMDSADFGLRQRAISVLRRWPRAEGIWSSVIMAGFSEALMSATDAIDGGLEVLENGLGRMTLRSITDTRESWPGRVVLVNW
ncbi:hypothetical protein NLG97_g2478 [Lecanicillium saksenae]|uniref:Uncharacterized protein n=1 Tax=Lecanicillium saksenae TaxID=468837 RepID=A0ACC1R427_9HYPO|nr:hypothetical protein NLG97_g2478 [Lecanicillium saksenae]